MLDRFGDDAADEAVLGHLRLLREAAAEHGGREVKSLGDGLMLVFPGAHSALTCAAAMQRRIDSRNRRCGPEMGLRIGVNAGEVVATEDEPSSPATPPTRSSNGALVLRWRNAHC